LKSRLEKQREKHGISIKTEICIELFDEEADAEAEKVLKTQRASILLGENTI